MTCVTNIQHISIKITPSCSPSSLPSIELCLISFYPMISAYLCGIVQIPNSWLVMSAALMLDISSHEKSCHGIKTRNPTNFKFTQFPIQWVFWDENPLSLWPHGFSTHNTHRIGNCANSQWWVLAIRSEKSVKQLVFNVHVGNNLIIKTLKHCSITIGCCNIY